MLPISLILFGKLPKQKVLICGSGNTKSINMRVVRLIATKKQSHTNELTKHSITVFFL